LGYKPIATQAAISCTLCGAPGATQTPKHIFYFFFNFFSFSFSFLNFFENLNIFKFFVFLDGRRRGIEDYEGGVVGAQFILTVERCAN